MSISLQNIHSNKYIPVKGWVLFLCKYCKYHSNNTVNSLAHNGLENKRLTQKQVEVLYRAYSQNSLKRNTIPPYWAWF